MDISTKETTSTLSYQKAKPKKDQSEDDATFCKLHFPYFPI